MFRKFYPGTYGDSAYEIDFQSYFNRGYRGLVFDIDNTLVPHGKPSTPQSIALFDKLHQMGFKTCLISNNRRGRVEPFARDMQTPFVANACKPSRKNYIRAMEIMHTDRLNTIFIGDQLFTDVWGANRTGIFSILVKPIHPKEEIQIILKRKLEQLVLFLDRRRKNS